MTPELASLRYDPESRLLDELRAQPDISRMLATAEALRARDSVRTQLLASAVRLGQHMLPALSQSLARIAERFGEENSLEAYSFPAADVNAFVSRQGRTTIVALSSTAIRTLRGRELDFVIGHELGHARYGHLEVPTPFLLGSGAIGTGEAMRLRSWQRATEISADRAGLLASGSLEVGASALFKTISGLDLSEGAVNPTEFASQWDALESEVVSDGGRVHAELTHPFPPLRMRAMALAWEGWSRSGAIDPAADREIGRMLSVMDPLPATDTGADPVLAPFLFWGGLHIALADEVLDPAELARLQAVAPPGVDVARLASDRSFRSTGSLERFTQSIRERKRKLSAVELHRIIHGLVDVAAANGRIEGGEMERLYELGKPLGISEIACNLILSRMTSKEV